MSPYAQLHHCLVYDCEEPRVYNEFDDVVSGIRESQSLPSSSSWPCPPAPPASPHTAAPPRGRVIEHTHSNVQGECSHRRTEEEVK